MTPPRTLDLRALSIAFVAALAACASLVKEPGLSVRAVGLHSIGLTGATVQLDLEVSNPNRFSLDARAMDYTLSFVGADEVGPDGAGAVPESAWQVVATGRTEQGVVLEGGDTVPVSVEVPLRYADVGRAVSSLLQDGRLHYRFDGAFVVGSPVGELRIPFDRTGLLDP